MDTMAKRLISPPYEKACPAMCDVGDVAIGALVLCFVLTLLMSTFGSPWRRPSPLPAAPRYPTFFALGFVGDVRDLKPTGRRGGGVLQ